MKRYIRPFSCLALFGVLMISPIFGNTEGTPPALIQAFLKKEGATVADLHADPALRAQLRAHLYALRGDPVPPTKRTRRQMPRRFSLKLPAYCQVIVENNLFRPLGYQKSEWKLKLELIGTMTYPDSAKNTAILMSNHPKYRRIIVKNGDTFVEDLTLTHVAAHQITYTDKTGQPQHLSLRSPFSAGP